MLLFRLIKLLFDNLYISDIEQIKGIYVRERLIERRGFTSIYTGELYLDDEHFCVIAKRTLFKQLRITGINADKYETCEKAKQKSKVLSDIVNKHIKNNTNNICKRINYRTNIIILSMIIAILTLIIEGFTIVKHLIYGATVYDLIGLIIWILILFLCYMMVQRVCY